VPDRASLVRKAPPLPAPDGAFRYILKSTTPPERNMIARRRCVLESGPQIPSRDMSAKAVPRFKENPGMMVGDGAVAAWWGRL